MLPGLRADDLLEAMFASAGSVGLCLSDPEGEVLRMNAPFARWANLDPATTSLRGWLERDAPAEVRAAVAEARAGRLGTIALHLVAASGTASRWEGKVANVAGEGGALLWSVREAPQEDEARAMREALDALPISFAIVESGSDGPRLLAYNRTYAELVQQPRTGDPFSRLPYEVYRPDRRTTIPRDEWPGPRAALTGERVIDTEMHLRRADGTWRVVSGSAAPLPRKPGTPQRSIAIILDLTARRAAEDALTQSEARYRGIFEKLNDQLLVAEAVTDEGGAVVDWIIRETNAASQRELGGEGPALRGTRASERLPEYFARVHQRWCEVLASGVPWEHETRTNGRDDLVRVFRLDARTVLSAALDVTAQKTAERTARILTARYERTVNTVPGALCDYAERLDGSAVFTYLSPGSFDLFERSPGELMANPELLVRMIHPEDAARLASPEARARREAPQYSEEFRIRTPSGKEKWVEYTRRANLGSPPSGSGFLLDISARKQAEARIAEERERLEVTLRSIGDAVIATDEDGKITLMNLVAESLTGWPAGEARGRPIDEVFHILSEVSRERAPNPVHRVLREGKVVGLANHTALVARDGSECPIADSGAPIRDPSGRMIGTVLVFRDQTEERRAEAAILRSRRELLELVEKLPLGVFVTRQGLIVYANPTFAQYLGYDAAAALSGKPVDGLLEREETASPGEDGTLRGTARTVWRARTARGGTVTLEGEGAREIDFEGTTATLWAVQDITELRAMHAQLMQADRLASVGTLAAGIAHEINNPLAYVIGSLDFMAETFAALERPLPSPALVEVGQALGEAREGAQRVKAVVRDLKTFSRADEERRAAVDLPRLLDSSVNMVSNELRHRARLEKAYAPTPPVVANEARLGQVFLNLIINAVQCLPEGRPEDERIRIVTGTDEAGRALVEVHDSGPGIPDEIRERIFDPFFTTKPIGVGTGLGLAICRNTIEALGGTIGVRRGEPRGTVFRVTIPAAEAPQESRRPLLVPAPGARGRVLVVDDEASVGVALTRLLRKEHDVTALGRAGDALERIHGGERWDVILCDLMMPEMTGMELYRELVRVAPEQAKRMVFLTGGTFTQQARAFLQEVRNVRVEKPFDSEELRALIRRLRGAPT